MESPKEMVLMCFKIRSMSETFHVTRHLGYQQKDWCTRTTLPISKQIPVPFQKSTLWSRTNCQRKDYNKSSKVLRPLLQGEAVRLATVKCHDRIGFVKRRCDGLRSYLVQVEGGVYLQNRKQVLPVSEPPPQQSENSNLPFSLCVQKPTVEPKEKLSTLKEN